jgi:ATP-dependent Clp protease ATP-binding subunit ClpA
LQENPTQPTVPPQPLAPSKPAPEPTLTEQAGQALFFARQYVDQFQLLSVNPEHLLIGLVREEYGIAGLILRDMGLQPKQVEEVVTELTHALPRTNEPHAELSQKTKNVFELAVDEAHRMGHKHIHTEHLLLGLLRQRQSVATDVLVRLGISTDTLRQKTRRILHTRPLSIPAQQSSYERGTQATGSNSIYLIESLMRKMLDMVGEGKLTLEQSNEMLVTLQPGLQLNTGMQAWLTTLLNQQEQPDTRRVQITASNRDTQQEVYTLTLSLAEALDKLDQLLLATAPDNRLESVDFESDSSPIRAEIRIVKDKDKTDE